MTHIRLISPSLVNLHALLFAYLKGTYPLFADAYRLSLPSATNLCNDSIDMALLLFLYDNTQSPLEPSTLNDPSPKPDKTYETYLAHTPPDINTLSHLPQKSVQSPLSADIIQTLSQTHHLPADKVSAIFWQIWGVCHYYIHHIAKESKLSQQEMTDWIMLQPLFYSDTLTAQAHDFGIALPKVQNTHTSYQQKLGRQAVLFDTKEVALPNHQWLLTLAKTVSDYHQTTLTIGTIHRPKPPTPSLMIRIRHCLVGLSYIQKIVLTSLVVLLITVIAYSLYTPQKPKDTPTHTPAQKTPIYDVAIIRTDNDDSKQTDSEQTDSQNDENQDRQ